MRVWLNHWFSTAYYFTKSLKEAGYEVIVTSQNSMCVYKDICDEFYIEPNLAGKEYVDWCIGFCLTQGIDVFMPKRNMEDIVEYKWAFDVAGIKVICENDFDVYRMLSSKSKIYEYFQKNEICAVPAYRLIRSATEFVQAFEYFSSVYDRVCIKFDRDEGGQSFKIIDTISPGINRLTENNGYHLSYEYVLQCLQSVPKEEFRDVVMMPYIEGSEVSVDCLMVQETMLAVPRIKESSRITRIKYSEELYGIACEVYGRLHLQAPFNIQFKYIGNTACILDVNTRLSGGCWKSVILGYDFAKLAVNKVLGIHSDIPNIKVPDAVISNLESAVVVNVE